MIDIEEQFRTCIQNLQDDFKWNDYAWDLFRYIMSHHCVLSETFLREFKDILITSIFHELLINQQLSLDFARELGRI